MVVVVEEFCCCDGCGCPKRLRKSVAVLFDCAAGVDSNTYSKNCRFLDPLPLLGPRPSPVCGGRMERDGNGIEFETACVNVDALETVIAGKEGMGGGCAGAGAPNVNDCVDTGVGFGRPKEDWIG